MLMLFDVSLWHCSKIISSTLIMNDSYHLSYLYFLLGQNVINIYFMKNGMRRMEDDLILFNSFNNIYNFCLVLNRHNL